MSACNRCRRRVPTQPWVTPGGLVLGALCTRCLDNLARLQAESERVLATPVPRPFKGGHARARPNLWRRHHPTARRIAAAMLADPALLALRSRTLRADAQARYGVGECEAKVAVSLARAASRVGDSRGTSRTER